MFRAVSGTLGGGSCKALEQACNLNNESESYNNVFVSGTCWRVCAET